MAGIYGIKEIGGKPGKENYCTYPYMEQHPPYAPLGSQVAPPKSYR
jgi:hypothetical protein